jgi:hypothetical protein
MNKLFSIIVIAVTFFGCQSNVQFNDNYFECQKDGALWRSINTKATVNSTGAFTISGYVDSETLTLKTGSTAKFTYVLGTANVANFANFVSSENKTYTTGLVAGVGPVDKIVLTNIGNSYVAASAVATTAVTGTGTGLKVDIIKTTTGGGIASLVINATGTGYAAGDIISIYNGSLTGIATAAIQNINSNGEITITDYSNGSITGTFKLNAVNATNTGVVNFQYGKFYKIPVTIVP